MYLLILFLSALLVGDVKSQGNIVFCYWSSTSANYSGVGRFLPSNIDPNLCSHIGYAFLGIGESGSIRHLNEKLDIKSQNIANTVALKEINPRLKIIAAVGGPSEESRRFASMAAVSRKRKTFISSAISFLQKHKLDGLDLHWVSQSISDRRNFVILLEELKTAFEPLNYTLSTALLGAKDTKSSDIANIAKSVDFINIKSLSYANNKPVAQLNSPLEGTNGVKASINYFLSGGAPADKLVMGLPFFGRSYTLKQASKYTVGAPCSGPGAAGPISKQKGVLLFMEICKAINQGWGKEWDEKNEVPYLHKYKQWVSYDDEESIAIKIDYAKELQLAGVMIWSIDKDDFEGSCYDKKFPLLETVNEKLGGNAANGATESPDSTSTEASSTTTVAAEASTTTTVAAEASTTTAAPTTTTAAPTTTTISGPTTTTTTAAPITVAPTTVAPTTAAPTTAAPTTAAPTTAAPTTTTAAPTTAAPTTTTAAPTTTAAAPTEASTTTTAAPPVSNEEAASSSSVTPTN